jgi:type I restriction enzyme S subunit
MMSEQAGVGPRVEVDEAQQTATARGAATVGADAIRRVLSRPMPPGWLATTIGEQVTLQRGIDITRKEQRIGSVPVISSGGISGYHDTPAVRGPGVVLGRKGALGTVYWTEEDYWPHDTTLWVRDFHGNDPRFVYYFFKSLPVIQLDVGTANPTLNRNHVHPIRVVWPPPDEQRSIARILSALDDKIELNRRMNETLEEMAQAIFKSWFVDFDPVRAPSEERVESQASSHGATQFPDKMEESSIGDIPAGWQVRTIGDVLKVIGGSTPSTKEPTYWDGGTIAWVTPKDLAEVTAPVLLKTERRITEAGLHQISSGLLPRGTVLLSSRAPIGYLAISEIPVAINQGFIAMVCDKEVPNHYTLRWAQHNADEIVSRANGSTFLEISKANFRPMPILVPSQSVLSSFARAVDPLHQAVVANLQEDQTLTLLRDALLPKLLSGDIRVAEAVEQIEAAV